MLASAGPFLSTELCWFLGRWPDPCSPPAAPQALHRAGAMLPEAGRGASALGQENRLGSCRAAVNSVCVGYRAGDNGERGCWAWSTASFSPIWLFPSPMVNILLIPAQKVITGACDQAAVSTHLSPSAVYPLTPDNPCGWGWWGCGFRRALGTHADLAHLPHSLSPFLPVHVSPLPSPVGALGQSYNLASWSLWFH